MAAKKYFWERSDQKYFCGRGLSPEIGDSHMDLKRVDMTEELKRKLDKTHRKIVVEFRKTETLY